MTFFYEIALKASGQPIGWTANRFLGLGEESSDELAAHDTSHDVVLHQAASHHLTSHVAFNDVTFHLRCTTLPRRTRCDGLAVLLQLRIAEEHYTLAATPVQHVTTFSLRRGATLQHTALVIEFLSNNVNDKQIYRGRALQYPLRG